MIYIELSEMTHDDELWSLSDGGGDDDNDDDSDYDVVITATTKTTTMADGDWFVLT